MVNKIKKDPEFCQFYKYNPSVFNPLLVLPEMFRGNDQKEALRAMQLAKKRQQQQEDIELKKKKIEEENSKISTIGNKFQHHYDAVEALLKTDTIGLVTLEDMKRKQEKMVEQRQQQLALERRAQLDEEIEKRQKKERQKSQIQKLSFAEEWEEEEGEEEEEREEKEEEKEEGNGVQHTKKVNSTQKI